MKVYVQTVVAMCVLVLLGVGFIAQRKHLRKDLRPAPSEATVAALSTVRQSHSPGIDQPWSRYTQRAVRVPAGAPGSLEQKVSLFTDGTIVRYEQGDIAVFGQVFIFDGRTIVEHTFRSGVESESRTLEGLDADTIKFQMATFGVLPLLKRLSAPGAQVTLIGATANGEQFRVDSVAGSWFVYTDRYHLIERVTVGDVSLDFQDYRNVDGLMLPFVQSVTQGTQPKYRLNLDSVVVDPTFAPDFFFRANP